MAEAMTKTASENASFPGDDRSLDTPYPVTEEQIASLHNDGWALLPGLISKEDAAKLCETLTALPSRGMLSGPDSPPITDEIFILHERVAWSDPFMKRVSSSRRVGGAMVKMMRQPEAVFVQDISFFKPVGSIEVPFHQDYSFWPFDREGCVTFWIALEDMEPEMGVLRYLKNSHREVPRGFIEKQDIRDVYPHMNDYEIVGGQAMKAGDAQVHWSLTVHGSTTNDGDRRRSALALRYQRPDAQYNCVPHPHYDRFGLKFGQKFSECPELWRVGPDGLIED